MTLFKSTGIINILIVVQNDLLGGAEQLLKLLATEYSFNNCKVDVLILRAPMIRSWDDLIEKVKIKYLNSGSYFTSFLVMTFYLLNNYRKKKYHLTISSNININTILGLLKTLNFINTEKLIIRETTSVFLRFKGITMQIHKFKYLIGYSSADLIICQTEVMRQQFLKNLKYSNKWNMKTIYNPINLDRIKELSFLIPENFEMSIKRKYIVSAGRFIPEKGFDLLIRAFSEIHKTFPDYDLLILGDGSLRFKYNKLINILNLNDRVFLPGFVKNPIPFFKKASICIVSSRFEGFPNVLLQMAATNNSIISTLCAGEIDKIPGILTCRTNDFNELALKIKICINKQIEHEEIEMKRIYLESNNVLNYLSQINDYIL
jgi:glycosyltransferase involved in cell wall biosynthesis